MGLRPENAANCDGHHYVQKMGYDLGDLLRSRPPYRLGMQPLALEVMGDRIKHWVKQQELTDLGWYNADVIHNLSASGRLHELIDAWRTVPHRLMVGPRHLEALQPLLQWSEFIRVPTRNAYFSLHTILQSVRKYLTNIPGGEYAVVWICAGMPANLLVHQLWSDFPQIAIMDVGSALDPYTGHNTRKYHARLKPDSLWQHYDLPAPFAAG